MFTFPYTPPFKWYCVSPFALTGIGVRVVAQRLFAGALLNSRESSWNRAHLVGYFLHSCWSSLAQLRLPQKVLTSSSVMKKNWRGDILRHCFGCTMRNKHEWICSAGKPFL